MPGSVKRLIINDQMQSAVAALKGCTDAINSAHWSSGLLLGTCCSCHCARLIIPSPPPPSPPDSPLQPAAPVKLLPLYTQAHPAHHPSPPPSVCVLSWGLPRRLGPKTKRLMWVSGFALLLCFHIHSQSLWSDMICKLCLIYHNKGKRRALHQL